MTFGDHGALGLLGRCRPLICTTPNHLPTSRYIPRWRRRVCGLCRRHLLSKAMMSSNTPPQRRLWNPMNGIQFASAAPPSLYPKLDLSRWLHNPATSSIPDRSLRSSFSGNNRRDDTSRTAQKDTESEKMESVEKEEEEASTSNLSPRPSKSVKEVAAEKEAAVEKEDGEEDDLPGDPPFSPLDYKIPEEAFRAARLAEPGKPESFWSYTLYRGPGEDGDNDTKVKVHYCRSKHTTERVCQYFLKEKVLGFDLEWVADARRWHGPRRNVCLVQLASESRIALFHLSLYPKNDDLVAPSFKKIMEDSNITKTGVWIKGDCTRLKQYLGIESRGLLELSHLFKLIKYSATGETHLVNKKLVSLAIQVQEHLHLPMFKGQDVRSSDWSKPLRMDQIIYSASDAYAAVQLFAIMEHQREQLDPTPPRPHHAELNLPIRLAEGSNVSSSDDADDAVDELEAKLADKVPTTLSQEFVSSATEDIKIESETDAAEPPPPAPKPRKKPSAPSTTAKAKDARIITAEAWLGTYRTSNSRSRAAAAALRSYHIWHANTDLDPVAIACLLREPPLQTSTVVSYILEAIRVDKLPYRKERLRDEVLKLLPQQLLENRYRALAKDCGATMTGGAGHGQNQTQET